MNSAQQQIQTAFAAVLALVAGLMFTLVSCRENKPIARPATTGEKVENKVKDALDTRPNEKLRDVGEDVEAGKSIKESVKDAAEN